MSWGSLYSEDSFNGLLSKDGVAESVSHMRELLILSPLNVVLATLVMVVVVGGRSVLESLLIVDLLSLRHPCSGGFSPSVVEVEEHVVQVLVRSSDSLELVELRRNVAELVKVLRSDLGDVQINQVTVVGINFKKLLLSKVLDIEETLDMDILVRKNH